MSASHWLRTSALIAAAGLSIATSQAPSWTVSDQAAFDVELSEGAPTVTFAVSVTFDVPDDETALSLAANARVTRSIGAGETMTVVIDADDGLGGGDTDARDLARPETFLTARADLDYCGRPCTRELLVTLIWDGAPANDFTTVELEIIASANGGDTTELPPGADVQLVAEPLP